ncbi:helix-turn-helix domain-containing protein, partial [Saccharopolyspora taberi]|uniref:helix-turn-helix domain-containing protein n=1 Tax=Saccharopolyspora taberi TaxID=60895 RepID=UPI0031D18D38
RRAAVTERCALRIAEAGPTARAVLGVLNAELPGVRVALLDPAGELVAGRKEAREAWLRGQEVLAEDVPGVGTALGRLVAVLGDRSQGWHRTVRGVMKIATGQITAWAAMARLRAERRPAAATAVLRRVLGGAGVQELREDLAALGWPTSGPVLAVVVVAVGSPPEVPDVELCAAWEAAGTGAALAPGAGEWICFLPSGKQVAAGMRRLAALAPVAAGTGQAAAGDLPGAVQRARAAAAVARQQGGGAVLGADELGARSLLAALPPELAETARHVLDGVLAADDGTLLPTLRAVLDAGGSVKDSARALEVHRNTVTARLERLRELGADTGDPQQRFALHLACHLLRVEG